MRKYLSVGGTQGLLRGRGLSRAIGSRENAGFSPCQSRAQWLKPSLRMRLRHGSSRALIQCTLRSSHFYVAHPRTILAEMALEREVFLRLTEEVGLGQIAVWVYRAAILANFVVQVGRRRSSRSAHRADHLTAADFLAGVYVEPGKVRVVSLNAAMTHHYQPAIAGHHVGVGDQAISCNVNRCPRGSADIHALVELALLGEWVGTAAKPAQQTARHRPQVRGASQGMEGVGG